jgi:hypothetical protein
LFSAGRFEEFGTISGKIQPGLLKVMLPRLFNTSNSALRQTSGLFHLHAGFSIFRAPGNNEYPKKNRFSGRETRIFKRVSSRFAVSKVFLLIRSLRICLKNMLQRDQSVNPEFFSSILKSFQHMSDKISRFADLLMDRIYLLPLLK